MTTTSTLIGLPIALAAGVVTGTLGAWWLHRRTAVSPRCLYGIAATAPLTLLAGALAQSRVVLLGALLLHVDGRGRRDAGASVAARSARGGWRVA